MLSVYFLNLRKVFHDHDVHRLEKEIYPKNVSCEEFEYLNSSNPYHKFNLYKLKNKSQERPLIIDIHGGAWVYGDKDLKKAFGMSFAERGYDVISMSYRLIDDVLLKDIFKDVFDCLNFIDLNHEKLGVSTKNVFITGDSAGGHLALVTSLILNNKELAEELGLKIPSFTVKATLLNHAVPYTDIIGDLRGRPYLSKFVGRPGIKRILYGRHYNKDKWYKKLATPVTYLKSDTKLPKLIVVTSTADIEYGYQSKMLHELMEKVGIQHEYHCSQEKDAIHVYNSLLPYTIIGKEVNDIIDNFFKNS